MLRPLSGEQSAGTCVHCRCGGFALQRQQGLIASNDTKELTYSTNGSMYVDYAIETIQFVLQNVVHDEMQDKFRWLSTHPRIQMSSSVF